LVIIKLFTHWKASLSSAFFSNGHHHAESVLGINYASVYFLPQCDHAPLLLPSLSSAFQDEDALAGNKPGYRKNDLLVCQEGSSHFSRTMKGDAQASASS
jgi:hypothetical protein